jgi:hypothetical protein
VNARSDAQKAVLRRAQEANRANSQALVATRQVPSPYNTLGALLDALAQRVKDHPMGFVGVAGEMETGRKSLWQWLRGVKIPDNATIQRMSQVLALALPSVTSGIEVMAPPPIPTRSANRLATRGSRWKFLDTLQAGQYLECSYHDRTAVVARLKARGLKIVTRNLSRDRCGVWIQST